MHIEDRGDSSVKVNLIQRFQWLWLVVFALVCNGALAQVISVSSPVSGSDKCYDTSIPFYTSLSGFASGKTTNSGGLDIVMVVDNSGSLTTTDPTNVRFTAIESMLASLPEASDLRLAYVWFSDAATTAVNLAEVKVSRPKIRTAIASPPTLGSTGIGFGLKNAIDELKANGKSGATKMILLFTDGMENMSSDPIGKATTAAGLGYIVNVIQLGDVVQDNITTASVGNGVYLQSSDPAALAGLFTDPALVGLSSLSAVNSTTRTAIPLTSVFGYFSSTTPTLVSAPGLTIDISATTSTGQVLTQSVVLSCTGSTKPPFSFTPTIVSQSNTPQANIVLNTDPEEANQTGTVWVGALMPNGSWRFLTPTGWTNYTGGTLPPYLIGRIGYNVIWFFDGKTDTSSFKGAKIYVGYGSSYLPGYGLSYPGYTTMQDDMITRKKFKLVYTVP